MDQGHTSIGVVMRKIHDYELIKRIMRAHHGWSYGQIVDEYTRQSKIPCTWGTMKSIIQTHSDLKALKRPYDGPTPQKRYDYEIVKALIEGDPMLGRSPLWLARTYNAITGHDCPASSMNGIIGRLGGRSTPAARAEGDDGGC